MATRYRFDVHQIVDGCHYDFEMMTFDDLEYANLLKAQLLDDEKNTYIAMFANDGDYEICLFEEVRPENDNRLLDT